MALARNWHGTLIMTVRITVHRKGATRRIQVAGRLDGEGARELVQEIGDDPSAACLELEELRSADAAGLDALRRMRAEGVRMHGLPQHLAWRIEAEEA